MGTLLQKLSADSYHTKTESPRAFFDIISMGTSVYFNFHFVLKLLKYRRMAKAGEYDTQKWVKGSLSILKLIEKCGGRFHIDGLNNIDKIKEPVVFISNHMSTLETMIFPGLIASRRDVTFVVKTSLVTHPIFGPVMKARNPITVERQDPIADFKKVMKDGVDNLDKKVSIVIFPQSKRTVEFEPQKFNKLGIKLAKKASVQIVPVAIKTDFWKNGKLMKDIGKIDRKTPIHIKFGEPIKIEGQGNKEHLMVMDFIKKNLKKWNEE